MIDTALIAAHQVALMLMLIGCGMICARLNWFTEATARALSQLLLYFVTPALLIHAFEQPYEPTMARGLLFCMALGILFHVLAALLAQLLLRGGDRGERAVARMGAVYSNCGFMAFPLVLAIFGEIGVFYGGAFVCVFNVALWTHGRALLLGRQSIRLKPVLLAPGVLGTIAGLLLYFTRFPLPGIVSDLCTSLASLNTPLAMIVIGIFLSACPLRALLCRNVLVPSLLRMVLIPGLFLLVLYVCGLGGVSEFAPMVCSVAVLCGSCPSAASTVLMTSSLGLDSVYGSQLIFTTSILSLLTIPLLSALAFILF